MEAITYIFKTPAFHASEIRGNQIALNDVSLVELVSLIKEGDCLSLEEEKRKIKEIRHTIHKDLERMCDYVLPHFQKANLLLQKFQKVMEALEKEIYATPLEEQNYILQVTEDFVAFNYVEEIIDIEASYEQYLKDMHLDEKSQHLCYLSFDEYLEREKNRVGENVICTMIYHRAFKDFYFLKEIALPHSNEKQTHVEVFHIHGSFHIEKEEIKEIVSEQTELEETFDLEDIKEERVKGTIQKIMKNI